MKQTWTCATKAIAAAILITTIVGATRLAHAAPAESEAPTRVQLRITTGDVYDAGTDDPVFISLNDSHASWLDAPGDDWERATTRSYDLTLDNVTDIASITRLRIGKQAPVDAGIMTLFSNAWCVSDVELRFNGVVVFRATLPPLVSADKCRWLKGTAPWFTWTGAQLRANSEWQRAARELPLMVVFTNEHLVGQVIAATAATLHANGNQLRWGDKELSVVDGHLVVVPEVTVTRIDDTGVHVRLDLAASVPGVDSEVDLDFDMRFACVNPRPDPRTGFAPASYYTVTKSNIRTTVDSWVGWDLLMFAGKGLDMYIWGEINDNLAIAGKEYIGVTGTCRQPKVRYNGDLSFLGF